ncbi:hypothetical protein EDC01DRAFT_628904 [Geopyxis carbonaria]|nr:hypothetical protein EDC01DRAFT_628904 [Geopyxis carbonaria]
MPPTTPTTTKELHDRAHDAADHATIRTALAAGISGLALVLLIIAWWFGRKCYNARRRRRAASERKDIDLVEELSEDLAVMEERFCGPGSVGRERAGSGRTLAHGYGSDAEAHMSWQEKLRAGELM